MAAHRLLLSQAFPDGPSPRAQLPGIAQCYLLSGQDRLPMAQCAGELCAVAHRLPLLPPVEAHGAFGRDPRAFGGAVVFGGGAKAARQRGDTRQSERQKHGVQRRAGLRCGQESQRTQAPHPGRYDGTHPAGVGVARQPPGPRRSQATADGVLGPVGPAATPERWWTGRANSGVALWRS
jgi:hypothetical protein